MIGAQPALHCQQAYTVTLCACPGGRISMPAVLHGHEPEARHGAMRAATRANVLVKLTHEML